MTIPCVVVKVAEAALQEFVPLTKLSRARVVLDHWQMKLVTEHSILTGPKSWLDELFNTRSKHFSPSKIN